MTTSLPYVSVSILNINGKRSLYACAHELFEKLSFPAPTTFPQWVGELVEKDSFVMGKDLLPYCVITGTPEMKKERRYYMPLPEAIAALALRGGDDRKTANGLIVYLATNVARHNRTYKAANKKGTMSALAKAMDSLLGEDGGGPGLRLVPAPGPGEECPDGLEDLQEIPEPPTEIPALPDGGFEGFAARIKREARAARIKREARGESEKTALAPVANPVPPMAAPPAASQPARARGRAKKRK